MCVCVSARTPKVHVFVYQHAAKVRVCMCDSSARLHPTDHVSFLLLCSCSLDANRRMSAPGSDCMDPDPNHLVPATQSRSCPPASGEHAVPRPGKTERGGKGKGRGKRESEGGRKGGQEDFGPEPKWIITREISHGGQTGKRVCKISLVK